MYESRLFKLAVFFLPILVSACGGGSGGGESGNAANAIQCGVAPTLTLVERPINGPRISGRIEIEANARVDKDPADLLVEYEISRLAQPEHLPSAVILGGYVSGTSGEYEGQSEKKFVFPKDIRDRYCIDLEPGQSVDVEFFTPEAGHSLRLIRALDAQVIGASSFETAPVQDEPRRLSLSLPADAEGGTYIVDVGAASQTGPSRYVLQTSPTARFTSLHWAPDDFRSGEAVVEMTAAAQASAQQNRNQFSALSLDQPLGNGQYKLTMPLSVQAYSGAKSQLLDIKQRTIEWIEQLRRQPDIAAASPNYIFRGLSAFGAVNEPLYPAQWHYPLINVPQAWQLAPEGGGGIEIAVLDTGVFRGVDGWHEDLRPNLPDNCGSSTCLDTINGGDPVDPGSALGGSVFHGTHVAGTIAASGNNGLGGAGVAPSARLLPVRVLDENGTGTLADVITGINWAVENGADVINLSLGSSAAPPNLKTAVENAASAGVLIVAAAGNAPTQEPVYPAGLDGVFGVGAVDGAGVLASYSSRASSVDLVGPGGDTGRDANQDGRADVVVSASGNEDTGATYAGLQGTSMATPHVAGVFALMKSLNPQLSAAAMHALLGDITTGPSGPANPGYGAGIIDAALAVETASAGPLSLLLADPTLLKFERTITQQVLLLNQVGSSGGSIGAQSIEVTSEVPWLQAGELSATDGGFSVPVAVDHEVLTEARAYRSYLTVTYSSGGQQRSFKVPVIVPVSSAVAERDAGLHYVLLQVADPDPGWSERYIAKASAQTALSAVDGVYRFNFGVTDASVEDKALNEARIGETYFLVAGSDLDNDGVICTPGEACAEYPVAGLRERVTVDLVNGEARLLGEDGEPVRATSLVMTTSFSRPLSAQSLPRPGFAGYKLLESAPEPALRRVAD